ncbi:MAG TPA: hypothetical protein PLA01_01350 [Acetivibrio sp.]|nr:hypothetical protein [Acetivibrio sp.]
MNYRNRYLKGIYGGIPITRDINFDELLEIMEWEGDPEIVAAYAELQD